MTIQQHASFDSSAAELNATSKLVKAWESKNAKNAARAGGVSLMALSLAACGGSSEETVLKTVYDAAVAAQAVAEAEAAAAATAQAAAEAEATAAATAQTAAEADAAAAAAAQVAAEADAATAAEAQAAAEAASAAAVAAQAAADTAAATAVAEAAAAATAQAAAEVALAAALNPTAANVTPLAAAQNLSTELTVSSDTITAANGTVGAGDVLADPSASDSDTMSIAHTGATLASTGVISNIENITVNAASTTTFTITDASMVTGGAMTINLTTPGGATAATVSDIGSNTSVIAGDRVADLTVDATADRTDISVTGGTGATTVNGTANVLTTATVDASAGTNVDVEFGAESSGITVTAGSGTVDINNGGGVETANLTVNAGTASTVTIDVGADSSNINVTTGLGAVDINNGTNVAVTGLVVDASAILASATIDIDLGDASDLTLTAATTAGAITLDGASVSETTDDGGSVTVTADAADIGAGITDFDDVNLTLNGTSSTVTLDDEVATFSLNATAATQTVTMTLVDNLAAAGGSLSGDFAMTLTATTNAMDDATIASDGAATHVLNLSTAQTADVDLSNIDNDIRMELGAVMAVTATGEFTLASGATIGAETAQTNAIGFTAASANSAVTLDLTDAANTGSFAFTNMATVTVTAEADNGTATTITVDSDAIGTAGNLVLTGENNISLAAATDAATVNASAMTGDLTAVMSATADTITGGAGDDSFTAYNGDMTVVGGTGDDTLTIGSIDISDDTVSISGVEVVAVGTADAVTLNGQLSGTETVTGTTGTLEVEGAGTADTINVSGFTVGLTQSIDGNGVIIVDAGAGNDTITGNSTNDLILAGAGNDTITAGGGQDSILGGAGGDTIILTETTSVKDFVGYTALTDWAGSVGAAAGTFSAYDVISGFTSATDELRFDSAFTAGNTTAAVTVIIDNTYVLASTGASTALADLTSAQLTDVDEVLAFLNDATVVAAMAYTANDDDLVAITDATGDQTAIYHVASADTVFAATEVSLVAIIDDILVTGDIDIV